MATTQTNDVDLWNDGQLRNTTLTVNAFPPEHVAQLPDEVFLDTPNGRVEMCRGRHSYDNDYWMVYPATGSRDGQKFHEFAEGFAHALMLVRKEAETDG